MVKRADILSVADKGENIHLMEPLLISPESSARADLMDKVIDLTAKSSNLRSRLPEGILSSLAVLVRTMNCYYSNLIEGHNTHPIDIEKALSEDFSSNKEKRNLQLEAKAHIEVQKWIDSGALSYNALTTANIKEIHLRFCNLLPKELLVVETETVVPGEFRRRFVAVGEHVPISAGAIPRFLERFTQVYGNLGKSESILAVPAAHHRLLWIHPFVDGNGRVARLISYAQLLKLLDTGGIWSIARGFARTESQYKKHLMACDQDRYNDYDGRGPLSEKAIVEFTSYFLEVCIDQVDFMSNLVEPIRLQDRILQWTGRETSRGKLPGNSTQLVQALLFKGELSRSEIPDLLGVGERQARRILSELLKKGVFKSKSDRAPIQISFSAELAQEWMPGLFPSK